MKGPLRAGLLCALGVIGLGACEGPVPSCPSDLPAACPAPAPGYAADIAPIVQRRCLACHGPGGEAQPQHDFTTYAGVHAQRVAVLNQVYACQMPPATATAPTAEERAALLSWLVCGAPD